MRSARIEFGLLSGTDMRRLSEIEVRSAPSRPCIDSSSRL